MDRSLDALVPSWLSMSEVAERLGVSTPKVKQYLKERQLVAVDRPEPGGPFVPEAFVRDGQILAGLSGTLILLHDAGYGPAETIRWLFSPHEELGIPPVEALARKRRKAVHRTAQVAGF